MDPTPDQQATDAALATYNQAQTTYNNAAEAYDAITRNPDATSSQVAATSSQLDSARSQLGSASRAYSSLLGKLATSYQANQRAAKDPRQQQLWANEADRAQKQAALYDEEARMYEAKSQAEIDAAKTRAQTALQRAAIAADRVGSQNDRDEASALLSRERAAQIPALSQSTIALHDSQIQLAHSRSTQALAAADRATAQANILIPAEAQKYVAQGLLSQAQADQLKAIGPVKVDELEAKLGLEKAKADMIRAQLGKVQIPSAANSHLRTLTEFNPLTGQLTGVPNPGYANPQSEPIKDYLDAIDQVQQMLATGKVQPDEADQLLANLKASLHARQLGTTPEALEQQRFNEQQTTANFGRSLLSGIQTQGNTMADSLLSAASKARGLSGTTITPYQNAIGMGGGPAILQQALSLIQQVRPISDRAGAMDAATKYAQASQILKQGAQQVLSGGTGATPANIPTPAGAPAQGDQAAQLTSAANAVRTAPSGPGDETYPIRPRDDSTSIPQLMGSQG